MPDIQPARNSAYSPWQIGFVVDIEAYGEDIEMR